MERSDKRTYLAGALAGTLATFFHTAVMMVGHAHAPRARERQTPPRQITVATARRIVPFRSLGETHVSVGTALLHFGYGAAAGALYTPLVARPRDWPVARGVTYGVGVWAASYLGWIPALGMPPPATRQPPQQNVTMLLAHVAWGAALGVIAQKAERRWSAPALRR